MFFFSSRRRHTRCSRDWSSDVCSSDLPSDTVRFTVGRFEVQPNSPNTVCGRALFTIDFRHPHPEVLARLGDRVEAVCRAHARGCAVEVAETLHSPPNGTRYRMPTLSRAPRTTPSTWPGCV